MTHRVLGLEHVGVAVDDLDAALAAYETLGFEREWIEELPETGARSHVLRAGDVRVELLECTAAASTLARFLERRGAGLHHLCLQVANLDDTLADERLRDLSYTGEPTTDQRGRRAFVHPRSTGGVLVGLVEVHPEAQEADRAPKEARDG